MIHARTHPRLVLFAADKDHMRLLPRLRARLKRNIASKRLESETLRESGLVDSSWYAVTYPDVASSGRDAVEDYLEVGVTAGRNPNPFFDTAWYLDRYPDVREAGVSPLIHFIEAGAAEGRDPGPNFSTSRYLEANPAVAASGVNPLLHFLRRGGGDGLPAQRSEDEVLKDYEAALVRRRSLVGAADLDHVHFPLKPPTGDADAEGRPLPPLALAQRIGAPTFEEFEAVGRGTREAILRCLPRGFDFEGARVLDFGCGIGRVLRYFSEEAKEGEFWGCDIDGPSIRWSVENMSPPFRLFQISEIPTIPLESNSFDLIYAISVFAHIHADWHHWMAEVRRVLKPGGYFFVTFMAQTPYEEMLRRPYADHGPQFGKYVKNPFADWNDGGPMAFHNPEWIKTYWGNLFDIEFIALEGLLEYQSICLMRKPEFASAARTEAPVVKYSAAQAFHPDAVGWIHEKHDRSRGFRESYGVEVQGEADVGGWIVFRGDDPVSLDLHIDGAPVKAEVEFDRGAPYRDWKETFQTAFAVRFDSSSLAPGEHKLEIVARSAGGKSHALSIPLVVLPSLPIN